MRNVLEYILKDEKVSEELIEITGPYLAEEITYDKVYQEWLNEKKLWGKDSGRMYAHNVISFHPKENILPAEVLEMAKKFTQEFFPDHQSVIAVHLDKDHLHAHIVTNSVSFIDGTKLHQTKKDLEKQKEFTNNLCKEKGLTIAEKGMHFDGTSIGHGEITAWDKNKYHLLKEAKNSYIVACRDAIIESASHSRDKNEFSKLMAEKGWQVNWQDSRKHIVFQNAEGWKIRDSSLEKAFGGIKVSKTDLEREFDKHRHLSEKAELQTERSRRGRGR